MASSPLPTPAEQANEVAAHYSERLGSGEVWAVLDARWWSVWCQYAGFPPAEGPVEGAPSGAASRGGGGVTGLPAPGPINNEGLADPDDPTALRRGLVENQEYVMIPAECFDLLHSWYGGGPAFRREVVVTGLRQTTRLDLYPLRVRFVRALDETGEPSGQVETVTVSGALTMAVLVDRLRQMLENDDAAAMANADSSSWVDVGDNGAGSSVGIGSGSGSGGGRPASSNDASAGGQSGSTGDEEGGPGSGDTPKSPPASTAMDVDDPDPEVVRGRPSDSDSEIEGGGEGSASRRAIDAAEMVAAAARRRSSARAVAVWRERSQEAGGTAYELVPDNELQVALENLDLGSGPLLVERCRDDGSWPRPRQVREFRDFYVGQLLDCSDGTSQWYDCTVRDVKPDKLLIHFNQFATRYDEWVPRDSARLAPLGTRAQPSRKPQRWSAGNTPGVPRQRGAVGLSNLGNTCFMNSTLQCLSNTPLVTEYFLSNEYLRDLNRDNALGWQGKVAEEYGRLIKELWSGEYVVVSPSDFKYVIGEFAPRFSGYGQQDSSELLSFLLDGLHEDLNRVRKKPATSTVESDGRPDQVVAAEAWSVHRLRNQSVVVDTLQGQLKSKLVCPVCSRVSITFDPFMFLSAPLPIPRDVTLQIAFVPAAGRGGGDAPVLVALRVDKDGSFADLRRAMAAEASRIQGRAVRADELMPVDVYASRAFKVLEDRVAVAEVQPRDQVYVYEVPGLAGPVDAAPSAADESDERKEAAGARRSEYDDYYGSTYSYHRPSKRVEDMGHADGPYAVQVVHLVTKRNPYYQSYSSYSREFITDNVGIPLVVCLPADCTVGQARARVAEAVRPFLAADAPEDAYTIEKMDAYPRDAGVPFDDDDDKPVWFSGDASGGGGGEAEGSMSSGAARARQPNSDSDDDVEGVPGAAGPPGGQELVDVGARGASSGRPLTRTKFAIGIRWTSADHYNDTGSWEPLRRQQIAATEAAAAAAAAAAGAAGLAESEEGSGNLQLLDCLRLFASEEVLSETDPWYCSKCKEHRCATKKFDLWRLPNILVIHLKRFSFSRSWREKIDMMVDFPLEGLDLSEFCPNPDEKNPVYDLYAVSNHYGGMGGGHYTAFCKNPLDGQWYDHDDSRVIPIRSSEVMTSAAYVLFYARREVRPAGASGSPSPPLPAVTGGQGGGR